MVFDSIRGIIERFIPQHKALLNNYVLYAVGDAHLASINKTQFDNPDQFILPGPITAVSSTKGCTIIKDLDKNNVGVNCKRNFLSCNHLLDTKKNRIEDLYIVTSGFIEKVVFKEKESEVHGKCSFAVYHTLYGLNDDATKEVEKTYPGIADRTIGNLLYILIFIDEVNTGISNGQL